MVCVFINRDRRYTKYKYERGGQNDELLNRIVWNLNARWSWERESFSCDVYFHFVPPGFWKEVKNSSVHHVLSIVGGASPVHRVYLFVRRDVGRVSSVSDVQLVRSISRPFTTVESPLLRTGCNSIPSRRLRNTFGAIAWKYFIFDDNIAMDCYPVWNCTTLLNVIDS